MNLIIGKTNQDVVNRFHVPIEWLGDKSVHLFIASSMWDTLYVDVTDDIPCDVLKYVVTRCRDIKVVLPEDLTEHSVELLCELYPDKSGSIRKAYTFKRSVADVLYS